jgi:hypothetical protein
MINQNYPEIGGVEIAIYFNEISGIFPTPANFIN